VSPSARLHFALVLLESGRDERAAKVLEGLYKRQPKDVVVLNNLAIALQRLGEFQRAAELLDGALAVDPKVLSTWINLANLALAQHTSARALECSERALALAPESAKANLVHGRVLQYQNRHAEAITAFERARTADPREFDALELLASSWKALGEPARAKASLAALAEERPFDARAHLALARACLELGQRVQAEHEFATARSLAPQDPEVAVLGRDLAASVR
jgi:tetratricopeptide (TPR) repeat protein